jgi:ribosome-interacting GTPase 1
MEQAHRQDQVGEAGRPGQGCLFVKHLYFGNRAKNHRKLYSIDERKIKNYMKNQKFHEKLVKNVCLPKFIYILFLQVRYEKDMVIYNKGK